MKNNTQIFLETLIFAPQRTRLIENNIKIFVPLLSNNHLIILTGGMIVNRQLLKSRSFI